MHLIYSGGNKIFHLETNINFLQFQFVVQRGNGAKGFVALDEVEFRFIEGCANPDPTTAPPITTKAPTTFVRTTVDTTEPPTTTANPLNDCPDGWVFGGELGCFHFNTNKHKV